MPKDTKPQKKAAKAKKQPSASNTGRKKRAPPFTAEQTNKILAAVLDSDPWNAPYRQREEAWTMAAKELNESGAFETTVTNATLRDKIRGCIGLHEGEEPERTVFSSSEGFVYHSLIDKVRGRIQAAKDDKDNRTQAKNNRDTRLDCQGHHARAAALTTHMQTRASKKTPTNQAPLSAAELNQKADAPSDHHGSTPEPDSEHDKAPDSFAKSGDMPSNDASPDVTALLSAIQHVNAVQGQRFERFMGLLTDQHNGITRLAEVQAESNCLLRCALVKAGVDVSILDTTSAPASDV
ncbi:hypothetical protein FRC07_012566 [Ceratobasidium sp. 392]|nr:hypothetical protein FRC07_012566 [Ceratobasidium sp. 392]